jgi:hypothetical protein
MRLIGMAVRVSLLLSQSGWRLFAKSYSGGLHRTADCNDGSRKKCIILH